ncbi:unnamed protein product [Parnassius mnemosyne]|uniref:Cilia- and flagella-associated protein 61 N-terminal domain-containing protein n=1 Tax=Parnassius mnemosyne TaxID=213953 RepID=A0AAV1KIM7_9NEOP
MTSRALNIRSLRKIRLAVLEDAAKIFELVNESMSKNFRISKPSDILYLIKNCVLSICQLNENDNIVGFLALQDFPLIPSVYQTAWEEYIWTKYKVVELTARNTLFVHLFCWNSMYARELVDNMLRSVFMHDSYLQYIAMIKSLPECNVLVPGQPLSEASFRRIQVVERGISGERLPSLNIVERNDVCLNLRIRRAVEEDNDDILPIIERCSKRLREIYGDFYISELVSRHPESDRVILVCEHKEVAVGVMCLNTQINYEVLEESFELSSFAGLRLLEDHSNIKRAKEFFESTISNHLPSGGLCARLSPLSYKKRCHHRRQRQNETGEEEQDSIPPKSHEKELSSRLSHLSIKAQLNIMELLEEDEEELEFDIVNIDTHLLRVPSLISYEEFSKTQLGAIDDVSRILDGRRKDSSSEDKNLKKERIKKSLAAITTLPHHKTPEPTRYSGEPNAFLIEIFAMHQDYDERFGFELLEGAFEIFPDRNYCIICLPSSEPPFPLLEHFTLVTPNNTRPRFVNESLFVAHINSVKGEVHVRQAEEYDVPYITDVLEHAPRKNELLELIDSSFTLDELDSYVLLSRDQPVGVVVLAPLEDAVSVRLQYALEPEPPDTDGNILVGVLSPVMEAHSRWYMRDILRRSHYTQLFWTCRLFAKGEVSPSRNLMSLACHMVPFAPYRSTPITPGNKEKEKIYKESSTPHALWTIDRPMTCLPKIYINKSIVVVGASRTGLSFLETLIMGPTSPYLTFTNLTLVSEHGLPTVAECLRAADTCFPRTGRYTDRYLKCIPYYFYIDVVSSVMIRIDRKKKCIHLKGGGVKYYDDLILTCGRQFQHPEYLNELLERDRVTKTQNACNRVPMDNPKYQPDYVPPAPDVPDNVMLINSLYDANTCLRKLLWMITESKENINSLSEDSRIVVYGDCIDAYACIAALLELGIAANMIAFVEPFPPEDTAALRVNFFNNELVDERIQLSLDKRGVQVYRQCYFTEWVLSGSRVDILRFMTPTQVINMPCFAFFYYGIKAIDAHSFKAITDCGLVYDGGLIVGPNFESNDPSVYGAGPCTSYSRRLHANTHAHRHYCSEDVGEALAALFLQKLDPFISANPDVEIGEVILRYNSSFLGWQPVMKFKSPIIHSATLPGPLYYLKLRKPGLEVPMAVQMCLPRQGHTLLTDKDGNYFRLQLNTLHCVESLTCLSKKPFSSENIVQIYGKHEAFFDKLLARYQLKQIDDLYDFFAQPWMSAMYHKSFKDLLYDIDNQDVGTECGQSAVIRDEVLGIWKAVGGERIVVAHLAHYLKQNYAANPHYSLPKPEYY